MTSIDDLTAAPLRVRVAGREVLVGPLRMRQVPGFSKAIAKPWLAIIQGEYLAAIMEWPEEIAEAMHIATGLAKDVLDELTPDDFLRLASAVFEVNLDFFGKAVLPEAQKMGARMEALMKAMSSLSQPASSASATATPTSSTTRLPN